MVPFLNSTGQRLFESFLILFVNLADLNTMSRTDAKDFVEPESRITSTLSTLLLRPKPNLPDRAQTFIAPLLQSEAMAIQAKKQRHRMNTSFVKYFG